MRPCHDRDPVACSALARSGAAPLFGCTALAYWVLHWDVRASWLAGVAMSTTSVAVDYAVMLEFGLNVTSYGKTLLAACFVNDLATVLALGFIFSAFTWKTGTFIRRLRTLTFGMLTPFYFIRAGSLVSLPALVAAPRALWRSCSARC